MVVGLVVGVVLIYILGRRALFVSNSMNTPLVCFYISLYPNSCSKLETGYVTDDECRTIKTIRLSWS